MTVIVGEGICQSTISHVHCEHMHICSYRLTCLNKIVYISRTHTQTQKHTHLLSVLSSSATRCSFLLQQVGHLNTLRIMEFPYSN